MLWPNAIDAQMTKPVSSAWMGFRLKIIHVNPVFSTVSGVIPILTVQIAGKGFRLKQDRATVHAKKTNTSTFL